MAIARYYVADQHPNGTLIPGVPLRDLTDEDFDALSAWDQASVDAAPFYRKTNPQPTPRNARVTDAPDEQES